MTFLKFALLCVLIPTLVYSAPAQELVKNLFGNLYSKPIYSGYLDTLDAGRKLHYMLVVSQNDPSTDPLVLWLNGGPGCSSMLGLFMENGPVVIDDYDPTFRVNNFSWNKKANVLYLESPAGVGFSYSTKGEEDLKSSDEKSGFDNQAAVVSFFKKFPEFIKNTFYIAGESYAGVYVPYLANLIKQKNPEINLKGILVGNGLTDIQVDVEEALVDFAYEHALYSQETYDKYQIYCSESQVGKFRDFNPKKVSHACNNVRKEIQASLDGLNIYDIYRICPQKEEETFTYQSATLNSIKQIHKTQQLNKMYNTFQTYLDDDSEDAVGIWPSGCKEDVNLKNFLNADETKAKLHVDAKLKWEQCSEFINTNYKTGEASFAIYRDNLVPDKKFKIWFYSGDTDAAVPFNGSIRWIPKLNMKVTEDYRPWIVNSQTAGYVQTYDNFKYVTIIGTGHMAPQWKREEGFVMFNAFLTDTPLPNK